MNRRRWLQALAVLLVFLAGGAALLRFTDGTGEGNGRRGSATVGDESTGEGTPAPNRTGRVEDENDLDRDKTARSGGRERAAAPSEVQRDRGRDSTDTKGSHPPATPAKTPPVRQEGAADARGEPASPADPDDALAVIEGRVLDREGRPVPGASVEASADRASAAHRTLSGDEGRFTFDALSPGLYMLRATKDEDEGTAGPVPAAGDATQHVTIFLGTDASIAGRVIEEETGEGVPGITVKLRDAQRGYSPTAFSDVEGRFRAAVPAPGIYGAWVSRHPDYYVDMSHLMNIPVAAGEHKGGVEIFVRKGVTLRGVVHTDKGEPVADATVLLVDLLNDQGGDKGQTISDAAGRFVFRGQKPGGRFVARAVHPDHGFGESRPVLAQPGTAQGELVVRLVPGHPVRGHLVTNDGHGVAGQTVWLLRQGGQPWRPIPGTRTESGTDGRFTIPSVPPGDFQFVVVTAETTRLTSLPFTVEQGESPEPVEVSLGNGPEGFVEGRVTSPEGEPLPKVEVMVWSTTVSLVGGQNTDEEGRYHIDGLGPAETVSVQARGFRLGRFRRQLDDVPVNSTGIDFVLGEMASLSGRVVDAETRAGLTSFHVTGPIVDMEVNSPDGTFIIDQIQVNEGTYRFSASGYLTATHDPGVIEEGQTITGVVIEMRPGGWLEGTVRAAETGAPVQGARVKHLQSGEPLPQRLDRESTWTPADPFTDVQGRFFLQGLPAGQTNSFLVWHPDYEPAVIRDSLERTFEISLGKTDL